MGKSLNSSHMRMRRKSGWPSKMTPYKSKISRSWNSAPRQTGVDDLLHLDSLLDHRVQPINSRYVRSVIEAQARSLAQKLRDRHCMFVIHEQRMLARRAAVRNDHQTDTWDGGLHSRFDLFQ